ncbi:MAG: type I secretion C-terminal target domain-containing protein [Caulobacteraceae bacterium]
MSPDTLTRANFALQYAPPSPDEAGNAFFNVGYAAVPGADEIIALSLSKALSSAGGGFELLATGYSVGGQYGSVLFQTVLADVNNAGPASGVFAPSITVLANGTVAIAWQTAITNHAGDAQDSYVVLSPSGETVAGGDLYKHTLLPGEFLNYQGVPDLYATARGFTMEWNGHSAFLASNPDHPQVFVYEIENFRLPGNNQPSGNISYQPFNGTTAFVPHAFATAPSTTLQIADNVVQVYDGTAFVSAANIPGEPAHAITSEATAILANGHAAVAWVDSGTAYVSLFDPSTGSFAGPMGLDWGGASDVHVVALPDGGFVTSWMNTLPPFGSPMGYYPLYEGRVYAADGTGGPVMQLAGDVAGIDSYGNLHTVASSTGQEYVVAYTISGESIGGPGDDVLHLGRSGNIASGGGGNDVFAFAEVPWNGGHITDFSTGDQIDLTGLLATTGYVGSDPIGAGFIRITTDAAGNGQIWADYNLPGNDGWWLVTTVDGVGGAALHLVNGVVTEVVAGQTVYTSDPTYAALSPVDTVYLTGSHQTVTAAAVDRAVTMFSNDTGNTLLGSDFNDLFHLGRGGDVVTGSAGADTFSYAETPWAGGEITDFTAAQGDRIDVSGLLGASGYSGSDPFADGYLKYTTDDHGNAQLWSDINLPGNDGWWLVATLDGVQTSSLHYSGGMIT